jgi:hypothetical protein
MFKVGRLARSIHELKGIPPPAALQSTWRACGMDVHVFPAELVNDLSPAGLTGLAKRELQTCYMDARDRFGLAWDGACADALSPSKQLGWRGSNLTQHARGAMYERSCTLITFLNKLARELKPSGCERRSTWTPSAWTRSSVTSNRSRDCIR